VKKTRNILVSLLVCLFVILAVPTAVSAAAKAPQCPKKQTLEFYNAYISGNEMPTEGDGYIYIKNLSRSAVITNDLTNIIPHQKQLVLTLFLYKRHQIPIPYMM
jgi:hypothetical protein